MKDKKKILVCVDRLTGGGAQRVASLWINGWCKQGHDVSVVLSNVRTPITYDIPKSVKIYNIDYNIKNDYLRHLLKKSTEGIRMRKILDEVKPDVVVPVLLSWGKLLLKCKGKRNFKIVMTDHNTYERPSCSPMSKHNQYLKFEYNKNFDQVTVLTQADVDFIGDRLNNVTHLPNPLAFEPVDKIPSKKNTIIAVGRLDAGYCKGFDVLIRALGLCKKSDWKLQIIGSGSPSSTEKYKSLAKECGVIDQTEFLGFLDNPVQAYRDAAIFVLSSRYEGFGMVLIEAMSQGCACIACDYKGRQKEIINDDKYGLLCSPDDPEELAKCINLMIEDEAYRKEVQENAPLRAKYYSLENIMNRWDDIFDKIGI